MERNIITIRDDELRRLEGCHGNSMLETHSIHAKGTHFVDGIASKEVFKQEKSQTRNASAPHDEPPELPVANETRQLIGPLISTQHSRYQPGKEFSLLNGNRGRNSQFLTCTNASGDVIFFCTICDLQLATKDELRRHVTDSHHSVQLFICSACSKVFCRKSALSIHMRIHLDMRPFDCKTCGKSFRVASHLRDHERVHTGERPFCCRSCGKGFKQSSDLRKHTFTHASLESNVRCRICRFRSVSHAAVMAHFKQSHGVMRLNQGECCCRGPNRQCTASDEADNAVVPSMVGDLTGGHVTNQCTPGVETTKREMEWPKVKIGRSNIEDRFHAGVVPETRHSAAEPPSKRTKHQLLLIQGDSQHFIPLDLSRDEPAVIVLQQKLPSGVFGERGRLAKPTVSVLYTRSPHGPITHEGHSFGADAPE